VSLRYSIVWVNLMKVTRSGLQLYRNVDREAKLRAMKPLWDNSPDRNGMYNRREAEAQFAETALADTDGDPCN
jgi:hypothetical protein